jgi:hypothetical protein
MLYILDAVFGSGLVWSPLDGAGGFTTGSSLSPGSLLTGSTPETILSSSTGATGQYFAKYSTKIS